MNGNFTSTFTELMFPGAQNSGIIYLLLLVAFVTLVVLMVMYWKGISSMRETEEYEETENGKGTAVVDSHDTSTENI